METDIPVLIPSLTMSSSCCNSTTSGAVSCMQPHTVQQTKCTAHRQQSTPQAVQHSPDVSELEQGLVQLLVLCLGERGLRAWDQAPRAGGGTQRVLFCMAAVDQADPVKQFLGMLCCAV
jgi:hypothetical protein